VKEVVIPYVRFPADDRARPGDALDREVMGLDADLRRGVAKAQAAKRAASEEQVFISVKDSDKRAPSKISRSLAQLGFSLYSTSGTAKVLAAGRIE